MRTLTAMIAPVAILALGACAGAPQIGDPFAPGSGEQPVEVQVQNSNWSDMRIYAGRDGGPMVRLGTVTSLSTRTFRIPRAVVGGSTRVLLRADPIGARGIFQTDPISVYGGDTIRLSLRNHLAISDYSVH